MEDLGVVGKRKDVRVEECTLCPPCLENPLLLLLSQVSGRERKRDLVRVRRLTTIVFVGSVEDAFDWSTEVDVAKNAI